MVLQLQMLIIKTPIQKSIYITSKQKKSMMIVTYLKIHQLIKPTSIKFSDSQSSNKANKQKPNSLLVLNLLFSSPRSLFSSLWSSSCFYIYHISPPLSISLNQANGFLSLFRTPVIISFSYLFFCESVLSLINQNFLAGWKFVLYFSENHNLPRKTTCLCCSVVVCHVHAVSCLFIFPRESNRFLPVLLFKWKLLKLQGV